MSDRTFKADVQKVESLRVAKGWTVNQLAAKAVCSTRTLDSIMAGAPALIRTLAKIAKALDVQVESIILRDDEEPPNPKKLFTVNLKLSIPFAEFDETNQLLAIIDLIKALLAMVGRGGSIQFISVQDGSTIITLEMGEEDYKAFTDFFHLFRMEPGPDQDSAGGRWSKQPLDHVLPALLPSLFPAMIAYWQDGKKPSSAHSIMADELEAEIARALADDKKKPS